MDVRVASPGYFDAMSIPVKQGRNFDARDRKGSIPVALISEAAVTKFFPGQDPIGRTIQMGWRVNGERVTGQVIGVVGGIRQNNLRDTAAPEIYFPLAQVPQSDMVVTVHTAGDPAILSNVFRDAVAQMDAGLAVANMRPMADVMNAAVASERFITMLLSVFSAIALLLAAVGIFGVISYGVAQRRREFGVRMAVGADRSEIMALVLRGAVQLAAAGLVLGALAAFAFTRVLESLLFDVRATDPITYIGAAIGLVTVAIAASALPAWTASRLPPSAVLNTDA
jgi:putative ABC transport system permease protein